MPEYTDAQLVEMQVENNPNNEPTGHFTGRCAKCGSRDLWDDATFYGCNCCGTMYPTADIMPKLVCNHCGFVYDYGGSHNCKG